MIISSAIRRKRAKLTGERNFELYPHGLQLYKYAPEGVISLEGFEKLALERLQALRIIEKAGAKHIKHSDEYKLAIVSDLKKQNLPFFFKLNVSVENVTDQIYDERKRDHISHFILRLAYCKNDVLRNWFLSQEVDLFKLRFSCETMENRKNFMDLNDLKYNPIENSEKMNHLHQLSACSYKITASKVETMNFYKVPFTEVLDLVKPRKVYLKKGFAFISEPDLVSLVVSVYRCHLSQALAITSRALPQLQEDKRLLNILNTIHQRYVVSDFNRRKMNFSGDVHPEMLDELSKTSFPLCMQNLHETLRKTHHLKYFGRLQYGLFLKGIGLTLDDAMRFWREEFTKSMDLDKFERQYAYGVRYNYGKEGKRANFTPYSCMKIITSNQPGPMDCHGCPFKHNDSSHLKQKLERLRIGNTASSEIVDLASKGHYQLACTRYFEVTHNEMTVDEGINHPNQYFERSRKIIKGEAPKSGKSQNIIATKKSIMYESSSQASSMTVADSETVDIDMEDIEDLLKGI